MKKIILILIFLLCLLSNVFAITVEEVLKCRGMNVTIVEDAVIPYTVSGTIIGVVTTKDNRKFVMLQTVNYHYYTDGIAFINLDNIIKIVK